MLSTIFIKKLFYFLTTGTLLFYIISFETKGNASKQDLFLSEMMSCQEKVKKMNSARTFALKEKLQVTHRNVLRLSIPEQKAINAYFKEMKTNFILKGESNPMKVSAYKFESKSNAVLGYKIVVQSWSSNTEEATYFTDKYGNIQFTYINTLVPSKVWNCEKEE